MNNDKIGSFFIKQRLLIVLEKWAIPIMSILLAVFFVYEGHVTYTMYESYQQKVSERNTLRDSLNLYKKNKLLSEQDRAYYGSILAKQIPAKENIFATYTFVDSFIASSGLEISQYSETSVPLASSAGVNILGVSVTGAVSEDRFDEIMNEYKFKYSRFMVMNDMNKIIVDDGSGRKVVNFSASFSLFTIPAITTIGSDLNALKLITFDKAMISKFENIKVQLNEENYVEKEETEEDIPVDYDTNSSLF